MSETPRCSALDMSPRYFNKIRAWRTLARELERALVTLREERDAEKLTNIRYVETHKALMAEADRRLDDASRDREQAIQVVRELYAALNSDPPDGIQKEIDRDGVIYRLDGQKMYHALNAARALVHQDEQQKGGQ